MKAIVPGHVYHLAVYDIPPGGMSAVPFLVFMRRVGPKYPGNLDISPGTNCQEVLRVLIDRCRYLNQQTPCWQTEAIIMFLQMAIWLFERRAKEVKGQDLSPLVAKHLPVIDKIPTCPVCGHILCKEHQHA